MRHEDATKGATLCGILEGWDQAIGEVLPRPSSIDEDVVLSALDQEHAHMGLQDLRYELQAVPHSVQVRCDKVELLTLDSIRPFIGMVHKSNQSPATTARRLPVKRILPITPMFFHYCYLRASNVPSMQKQCYMHEATGDASPFYTRSGQGIYSEVV